MARDISLVDPLSEVTRKERRMLLGLSVLSVFIIKTGAVPTKISALGIEFGSADQRTFFLLLSFILAYFSVAFFVYALSDFLAWRKEIILEILSAQKEHLIELHRGDPQGSLESSIDWEEREAYRKSQPWRLLTAPASVTRAVFEFLLPLGVGLYATWFAAWSVT